MVFHGIINDPSGREKSLFFVNRWSISFKEKYIVSIHGLSAL